MSKVFLIIIIKDEIYGRKNYSFPLLKPGEILSTNVHPVVFGPHVPPPPNSEPHTDSEDFHATPLALVYLGANLRKSDIVVVRPASMLREHKNSFVLHAVDLGITHVRIGLLMTESGFFIY